MGRESIFADITSRLVFYSSLAYDGTHLFLPICAKRTYTKGQGTRCYVECRRHIRSTGGASRARLA